MTDIDREMLINSIRQKISSKPQVSSIIKISWNDKPLSEEEVSDKIQELLADFGITSQLNPALEKIFFKMIYDEIIKNINRANLSLTEAAETTFNDFRTEAERYRAQLFNLAHTYSPTGKEPTSSLTDFLFSLPTQAFSDEEKILEGEDPLQENNGTVRIRALYMPKLQGKMDKLAKIATKLGLSPPYIEVISEETVVDEKTGIAEEWYQIKIHGESPQINGWKLIAKLEHSPVGRNIVYAPPSVGEIPEEYYTVANNCEHCGYDRRRKNTYLLENISTGTIKQVGSACLQDFTGHPNPEVAAAYFERLSAINIDTIREENEEERYRGEHNKYYFDPVVFLSHISAMIKKYGWVSKTQAMNSYDTQTATVYHAISNMFPGPRQLTVKPSEEDRELAIKALEWIRGQNQEFYERNNYLNNLWVVAHQNQPVAYQHLGLLASLIPTYQKAASEKREKEIVKEEKNLTFIGEVGERRNFIVTVNKVLSFPSNYANVVFMHQMFDQDGNVVIWWTNSDTLDEGQTYQFDATIKEHKYYNGVPQTIITRPSKRTPI